MPLLGHFPAYARDPLGFVARAAAEYGGVVPFRLGPYPALLLMDPEAIEEVFVTRTRDFRKSRAAGRVHRPIVARPAAAAYSRVAIPSEHAGAEGTHQELLGVPPTGKHIH